MQIVSFVFTKVNTEKLSEVFDKNSEAKTDIKIVSVSKEKLDFVSQEVLKFAFSFTVGYANMGKTSLEGYVIVLDSLEKIEEILNNWQKSNKFNNEITLPVINAILYNCNIKALELGHIVNLPAHINLPLLQKTS